MWEKTFGHIRYNYCSEKDVVHLYGYKRGGDAVLTKTFGYEVPCLGGIFCISPAVFTAVNGFTISAPGWGYEDQDLGHRVMLSGHDVDETHLVERNVLNSHVHDQQHASLISSDLKNEEGRALVGKYLDGLMQTRYELIVSTNYDDATAVLRFGYSSTS